MGKCSPETGRIVWITCNFWGNVCADEVEKVRFLMILLWSAVRLAALGRIKIQMKSINTCCCTFPILSSFSTYALVFVMSVPLLHHLLFMTTENRTHSNSYWITEIMWKFQNPMTDQGLQKLWTKKLASQNEQSLKIFHVYTLHILIGDESLVMFG